jgi:hypothetical protein
MSGMVNSQVLTIACILLISENTRPSTHNKEQYGYAFSNLINQNLENNTSEIKDIISEDLNHTKLNSKNIFLIPTDRPSRIFEFGGSYHLCDKEQENFRSFNLYITSNEIIKDDYYQLNTLTNKVCKNNGFMTEIADKKIILTTDPDLIKDGVQSIDDEFIQWFVKNSSCDSVEVIPLRKSSGWYDEKNVWHWDFLAYKIIIPHEEPKQETLEEAAEYFAHNNFNMHDTNNYKALKEGFIKGYELAKQEIFEWLSYNDLLTDEVDILQKEFENSKGKQDEK